MGAAYLQSEQEDARLQTEQMERRLVQLRRKHAEACKAVKEGEQQAAAQEAKVKSLLACRNADEATRRRKATVRARNREAAELWARQHSQRECANVLATEAREQEQERRAPQQKDLSLSKDL